MVNINIELFKRYAPKTKLEIVKKLTPNELMYISPSTIERIVREEGERMYKSRNKRLYISRDRRRGNSWNSVVEAVELIKGNLYLDVYVQYENTDTNTYVPFTDFMKRGDFRGEIKGSDRCGNGRTYYYTYDEGDKQKVLRSILEQYIHDKYSDRL